MMAASLSHSLEDGDEADPCDAVQPGVFSLAALTVESAWVTYIAQWLRDRSDCTERANLLASRPNKETTPAI
jgi:hypothetical protein